MQALNKCYMFSCAWTAFLFSLNCWVFFRFYTLLVLATALFGQPPFKNVIVNGLVLARQVPSFCVVTSSCYDTLCPHSLSLFLLNAAIFWLALSSYRELGTPNCSLVLLFLSDSSVWHSCAVQTSILSSCPHGPPFPREELPDYVERNHGDN